MNYRHAYHAGNHADVFKHAVLCRIIEYLKRKQAAFRFIDTHAGTGLYDLSSVEAAKTGEWLSGAGRLISAPLPPDAAALLEPLLSVVSIYREAGKLSAYPGSPMIARHLLRPQDRLSLFELHRDDFAALAGRFAGDWQVKAMHLDGWLAAGAHLPPKEKRGLVLIDPPFEAEGEFERLENAFKKGASRWPGGIFVGWYPLKNPGQTAAYVKTMANSGIADLMLAELWVSRPLDGTFHGSGLIIRNPPFVLREELEIMLPALAGLLARGEGAGWRIKTLAGE